MTGEGTFIPNTPPPPLTQRGPCPFIYPALSYMSCRFRQPHLLAHACQRDDWPDPVQNLHLRRRAAHPLPPDAQQGGRVHGRRVRDRERHPEQGIQHGLLRQMAHGYGCDTATRHYIPTGMLVLGGGIPNRFPALPGSYCGHADSGRASSGVLACLLSGWLMGACNPMLTTVSRIVAQRFGGLLQPAW